MSKFLDSLAQTQEMAKRDAWDAFVSYVATYEDMIRYAHEHPHIRYAVRDKVNRVAYDYENGRIKVLYDQRYLSLNLLTDTAMRNTYGKPEDITEMKEQFDESIRETAHAICLDKYTEQYKEIAEDIREQLDGFDFPAADILEDEENYE